MDVDGEDEVNQSLTDENVFNKYKTAADVVNLALNSLIKECTPGKKIIDLCVLTDKVVADKLATSFSKVKVEKGLAFPTSISVNNVVGHFSPLLGDATVLNEGDVAKIDIGVHVDGFISVAAHTIVVQENAAQPITGRKADVISAALIAADAAHRLIRPGNKNTQVTEMIKKVAESFKCEPVEGVLSHEMKRFVIDGNKTIINKASLEHKVDEFEFEQDSIFSVDIVMSTGEGKAKDLETRTTIYKRAVDQTYNLKMQASRYVLNEINKNFPTFPFALRALDEKKGKLGITECLKHELVYPFPVLFEKAGEFVAQVKFTVLITGSGTTRLNNITAPVVQSEYKITDPSIEEVLKLETKIDKKKNKKKPAKSAAAAPAPVDAMDTSK